MRITEAAQALGTSPRMLRYRESLGLLPPVQPRRSRARRARASVTAVASRAVVADVASEAGRADGASAASGAETGGAGGRGVGGAAGHRQFSEADLAAVALGLSIERRYDISPTALSFAIRVLADPRVRAEVAELGRRIGRIQPLPARALDFEQERALRLLRLDPPRP
jgi:MerR family transcriptional regulator, copper efflux regulator